jgi:hypothetical protein
MITSVPAGWVPHFPRVTELRVVPKYLKRKPVARPTFRTADLMSAVDRA